LTASHVLQLIWTGAVVWALLGTRREQNGRTTLLDASLILLLPLPLSGQLQPHHAVVLLPAVFLLAADSVDVAKNGAHRFLCATVLLGAFILMEYSPSRQWRGLALHAAFILYLVGLAAICKAHAKRIADSSSAIIHD
jgi:hypothetical protein